MSSATAPAAATGLPKFDPQDFDLALHHLARLLDLMVTALCQIDRDKAREAERELLDADTLAWTARALAERLSAEFETSHFRPTDS